MIPNRSRCLARAILLAASLAWPTARFAVAQDTAGPGAMPRPRRALVVGNDSYASAGDRLLSCRNDAAAIRAWLLRRGYRPGEITLLLDARRAELLAALDDLVAAGRTAPHEEVFVYFSGHGYQVPDDDGDEAGTDGDGLDEGLACVDRPDLAHGWDAFADSFLVRDDRFFGAIRELRGTSARVVVTLDACFAGGAFKGDLSRLPGEASYPTKRLHDGLVLERLGAPPVSVARRPGGAKALPGELERGDGRGSPLLFLASSRPDETSAAGRTASSLSPFTEQLLSMLADRHAGQRELTLARLREDLTGSLRFVSQTPVVAAIGMDESVAIRTGTLPDLAGVSLPERATEILADLLTLPAATRDRAWSLKLEPSLGGPIPLGTPFHLNASTDRGGYAVLLAVWPDGRVAILYPNLRIPGNRLEPGCAEALPAKDGLIMRRRAGQETCVLFLLERDPLGGLPLEQAQGALVAGHLDEVADRLRLRGVRTKGTALAAVLRGETTLPAQVRPDGMRAPVAFGRWTSRAILLKSVGDPGQ